MTVCLALTIGQQLAAREDTPGVPDWVVEQGKRWRFRLHHEDSTRVESLDADGERLRPPRRIETRSLTADLGWTWARSVRNGFVASVTIERIVDVSLPGWAPRGAAPVDLDGSLRIRRGRELSCAFTLKGVASVRLGRWASSPESATAFRELVAASVRELLRVFPPSTDTGPGRPRRVAPRDFALGSPGTGRLEAHIEIETIGLDRQRESVLLLDGSVRQSMPGATIEVQRLPGLFPGSVTWRHDRQSGFPELLEIEKVTLLPVADTRLPIVNTLIHTYRLRISPARP